MHLTTNYRNIHEWGRKKSQFCTEANEGNKEEWKRRPAACWKKKKDLCQAPSQKPRPGT
jgi:hypothetical protein